MRLPFVIRYDGSEESINDEWQRRCDEKLLSQPVTTDSSFPNNVYTQGSGTMLINTVQQAHLWDGCGRAIRIAFSTIIVPIMFEQINIGLNFIGWLNKQGWGIVENSLPPEIRENYHSAGLLSCAILGLTLGIASVTRVRGPLPGVDNMPSLSPLKNVQNDCQLDPNYTKIAW